MFPVERPQVFFLTTRPRDNVVVELTDFNKLSGDMEALRINFIKEYIRARNEFTLNNLAYTHKKWTDADGGIVKMWSSPGVFEQFKNNRLWYDIEDMWRKFIQNDQVLYNAGCTVEFRANNAVRKYPGNSDYYLIEFIHRCQINETNSESKVYRIKLKLQNDTGAVKWSDRFENPLGIRVIEYTAIDSQTGAETTDPLDMPSTGWEVDSSIIM